MPPWLVTVHRQCRNATSQRKRLLRTDWNLFPQRCSSYRGDTVSNTAPALLTSPGQLAQMPAIRCPVYMLGQHNSSKVASTWGVEGAAGTCVRETPLERVVGMQQKTASPKANSGRRKGSRSATRAAGEKGYRHQGLGLGA